MAMWQCQIVLDGRADTIDDEPMLERCIFACLVTAAVLATTCCALDDSERLASVKPGMTPQQVERYMGRPAYVDFKFEGAGASQSFDDTDPKTKGMTTARAIALPDWDPELKAWLTDTAKTYGPLKSVCTIHTVGNRDYECCFANGRLTSMRDKIWLLPPHSRPANPASDPGARTLSQ
jgi:hypothetical protein